MSKKSDGSVPFDPTTIMKDLHDAGMEQWAKLMTQYVNTDTYAQASGEMLDAWLSSSTPFRKALENAMAQSLAGLSLPSRDDVTRLAERLTNIEMRLDDMDAKLDECIRESRKEE